MLNRIFFVILILYSTSIAIGQSPKPPPEWNFLPYRIENGDTIFLSKIDAVYIIPEKHFKSKREYRRYTRLIRNVKKVYPYAKLAKKKLDEFNTGYITLKTDTQKKAYAKKFEKEIKEEFEDELKELTISQGRILIRLIDRETGNTSYELLKEFRGSLSAIFWQTLARIFGSNLKWEFDAVDQDKAIEEIIVLIELGII
jgi:hypothetical protein